MLICCYVDGMLCGSARCSQLLSFTGFGAERISALCSSTKRQRLGALAFVAMRLSTGRVGAACGRQR